MSRHRAAGAALRAFAYPAGEVIFTRCPFLPKALDATASYLAAISPMIEVSQVDDGSILTQRYWRDLTSVNARRPKAGRNLGVFFGAAGFK